MGMIFACNYPLTQQWFDKAAKAWRSLPLWLVGTVLAGLCCWWLVNVYSLPKVRNDCMTSWWAAQLHSHCFFSSLRAFDCVGTRPLILFALHQTHARALLLLLLLLFPAQVQQCAQLLCLHSASGVYFLSQHHAASSFSSQHESPCSWQNDFGDLPASTPHLAEWERKDAADCSSRVRCLVD